MAVRRLYLLRHAKSSWEQEQLGDLERPLAKRGRKACKLIAAHLREREIAVDAALVSPARRTQETFERIRAALPAATASWTERRLYGAGVADLLEVIRELPPDFSAVLLVGHNPGIQQLTTALAGDGRELARVRRKFPTGALATIGFASPWLDLRPGIGELEDFVRPKQLG